MFLLGWNENLIPIRTQGRVCRCKTEVTLTIMTNRAGATNAQTAPFFRDSQQLEGKHRDGERQNTRIETLSRPFLSSVLNIRTSQREEEPVRLRGEIL